MPPSAGKALIANSGTAPGQGGFLSDRPMPVPLSGNHLCKSDLHQRVQLLWRCCARQQEGRAHLYVSMQPMKKARWETLPRARSGVGGAETTSPSPILSGLYPDIGEHIEYSAGLSLASYPMKSLGL